MDKEKYKKPKELLNLEEEFDKSKEYMAKYQKAKTFNSERMDAYAENMAFYQGNQHLLKRYKNETPWIVNMNTPHASIAIDNRVASILANDYIGELIPVNETDVETVEKLCSVYKKEWKRMELDNVVRECISNSAIVREAYCHIVLNKDRTIGSKGNKKLGRLEAYYIEPSRIFIDPNARNLKNAKYLFVADRISKCEAKEKYSILEGIECLTDNHVPKDRGEVFLDNDYTTEQDDVITMLTYYGKEKGKIKKVVLISDIIVEEKEMPISIFPILQLRWKKAAQSCYGLSLMDDVIALQKAITSIESAITNTAVAYAAPSMMVRRGCGVDPGVVAKANGAPGVVYSIDGNLDNAIKPVVPPQIKQETLSIKNDFIDSIDKITGNTSQFLGDIGTAGNTSNGTNNAIRRATIIENKILNNIREFVQDITEVVIEFIKQIYYGDELTYNDGKQLDGSYKFSTIKLPGKVAMNNNSNYDYYIELETKTPYNKDKQKDLLLEIFQLERQYDAPVKTVTVSDIIKNSDIERKDEIIKRYNDLTYQDATTKAEAITQLYAAGMEAQIDNNLLQNAMAEIIANQSETPSVDQVMSLLEQDAQAQMQQAEQQMDSAAEMLMATPQGQADIDSMARDIEGEEVTALNELPI